MKLKDPSTHRIRTLAATPDDVYQDCAVQLLLTTIM